MFKSTIQSTLYEQGIQPPIGVLNPPVRVRICVLLYASFFTKTRAFWLKNVAKYATYGG